MPASQSKAAADTRDAIDAPGEPLGTIAEAYSRFVPREFLTLLGIEDIRKVEVGQQVERKMTILFSDIRDFTSLSESMSPQENFNFLNSYLVQMEPVIAAHGGFIDKYIGDGIMALFPDSPDAALRCSLAMLARLDAYNRGRERAGYSPIKIGIGINTGIVILGTVGGASRMDGTVIGDAVNLAARLERLTKDYRVSILISEYTLYCLDEPALWSIRFLDRTHVRGKQDNQAVYEVFNGDPPALREAKMASLKTFEQALASYHGDDLDRARERFAASLATAPDDAAAQVYLERCDSDRSDIGFRSEEQLASWHAEYSTGHLAVDGAHIKLLTDMNDLAEAVKAADWARALPLLAQIQFAAAHDFLVEEQLMMEDEYPFTDLHNRQHQRFFEYFGELRREIERGEDDTVYLNFRTKRLLADWLVNHILNADRHFGHYLNARRRQATR